MKYVDIFKKVFIVKQWHTHLIVIHNMTYKDNTNNKNKNNMDKYGGADDHDIC